MENKLEFDFLTNNTRPEDGMSENEKKELYASAHSLVNKKSLNVIIDHIINVQANFAVRQAENMEQVAFARATINGVEILRQELERLQSLFKQEQEEKKPFNKFDVI